MRCTWTSVSLPAGGHVGGDQDRAALVGELDQDLVAFALLQVAVQGLGADAVGLQPFDQVVAADLGVAEGQRGDGAEVRQQARHGVQAVLAVDFVEDLFDAAGVVLRFDLDFGRVAQEPGAELADVVGVGGRKQQRLAFGRAVRGDGDDVVIEAHVDHAVGFVQHQRGQAGQVQAAARQVVLDAAGRADDQVGAARQRFGLGAGGGAAAQGQDLDVGNQARQPAQFLRDLIGQFTGGTDQQRLGRQAARVQLLQHAQAERRGLAAARLGLRDDVAAFQDERQALRLDGRHLLEPQALQVVEQGGQEGQGGEGRVGHNRRDRKKCEKQSRPTV
ncbi:hypothetical protein G6F22_014624 [Rhizopus arrhizus]|nr:hypothetical protein G6F22_014624 [Rhizopus arrhizus]